MYQQTFSASVVAAVCASLLAQGPVKNSGAAAWVAAYQKAGGKAELATGSDDIPGLAIEKRKGQKPLVTLKGVGPAPGIRSVTLQGYEVSDEDLEALSGWKDLERLEVVDGAKVTDKGAKAIGKLPKLRSVGLHDTTITGAGVTAFGKHDSLAHFALTNTTSEGQVQSLELKELPKLETVTLAGEGITQVVLANLPQLQRVGDFPRSLEVADISGLGRVRELDFRGTRLKSLSLSDVPLLEALDLRQTELPDGAVAALRNTFPGVKIQR
jgi:hypothetical protein